MPGYPRPRTVSATRLATLAPLVAAAPLTPVDAERQVTGVTHASGEVRPGDLYAALPGSRRHGAEFVDAAVAAGAVAVLTDETGAGAARAAGVPALVVADPRAQLGRIAAAVYGNPTERLAVIGITGTNGKTSTAYLVESGLTAAGRRTGLIGTVETRLGDERLDSTRTTPEATDLQALFAVALERGLDTVVMEVSSHALDLGRVTGTRFAVGAFTNFGVDHLDFHGTVDEYFAAKAKLFDGRAAVEVLNADDPAVVKLAHPGRTVTVSVDGQPAADWRAGRIARDGYGQRFEVAGPGGVSLPGSVAMPGRHNVANALLAVGILAAVGVDPATAVAGVAACGGVPGRMERVVAPGEIVGVVDFAHTPNAVAAALAALREAAAPTGARVICVVGAGGDRDQSKRALMGEAAARGADEVVVTDDNPRTEDPAAIRAQVLAGALAVPEGHAVDGGVRSVAIAAAVAHARPGDIVAVLGKGHEQGQEVSGEVYPFDDRIVLRDALAARAAEGDA
ncbi:UDP-N-acetylmuramoyl-L-alanyl-D-glutamate--2,6-diaminopimelate ligase [Actinocatenispora rupis]|uniref:UDP-N-acetylmuramoyl-L-alanyl-D-glutamate--2,6-diaminopimelate ligase n=1 Tax=Actinocatenispora rupis TaxID=519421 RepID=A0A8J3J647_9ACTN|nr:UDP-N-acetylmuramoyl-L-alanyl-D-glutamate--2,6-diaminopimelate ligase [Actinocatenispora rupis]GID09288.1 UDP-N-acetylmuramoyl-L-alanyl-D-glutamate--2,6-diaminopimelate ligase [Actinocatenispora rupis]